MFDSNPKSASRCNHWCVVLVFLLTPAAVSGGDEPSKKPLSVARITGPLICAHCDLGIGDECRAAIQIEDVVFVLQGKANDDLVELRLSGGSRRILGVLSVQDGYLHLRGVNDPSLTGKAKAEMIVTGRLIKTGDQLALAHGKAPILLRGKTDQLQGQQEKWVQVRGSLDVDRKGRIRLSAKSTKLVAKPPVVPR